ncbi:MAG: glutathione S-transferase family protein [Pseudomonadales bacterium]|nr:glutathione S-transferase family protein [Pseudomonadales bacterium]
MIRIYHVPRTRSIRVIWLCEELGLEYERVPVDFSPEYRFGAEWRKMNPVGKVPVMFDGDLKLFESGAMVQYLLARYGEGRLQPLPETDDYARFLQWCWFAEATFARPLGEIVNHRRVFAEDEQSDAAIREMQDRAWLCVEALEEVLTDQPYLAGKEFTAADIMNGYSLMLTEWLVPKSFPEMLAEYWGRLSARRAYIAAMQ